MRSWMVTSDFSFRQEEVALATGGRRCKLLPRPTSTTDSLVWATCSTWEAMFPTVEAVVMAIITTEDLTTTMEGLTTTTTEDSTTTMVAFTTTTMEDSAMVVRVRVREVDVSVSTASHSVTGMGMYMVPARGETVVEDPGAIRPAGT